MAELWADYELRCYRVCPRPDKTLGNRMELLGWKTYAPSLFRSRWLNTFYWQSISCISRSLIVFFRGRTERHWRPLCFESLTFSIVTQLGIADWSREHLVKEHQTKEKAKVRWSHRPGATPLTLTKFGLWCYLSHGTSWIMAAHH